MQLYALNEKYAASVRKELDPNNKNGIFSRILWYIDDNFGHSDSFTITPDDLEELAGKLRQFDGYIRTDFKEYIEGVGIVPLFDFYSDICNVLEVIKDHIYFRNYNGPVLIVDTKAIIAYLNYKVNRYLTKESEEEE